MRLPEIAEKSNETSSKENHEIIVLFARYFS